MNLEEGPKEKYNKDNIFLEEYSHYLSKQNKNQIKHFSCSGKDDTVEDSSINVKISEKVEDIKITQKFYPKTELNVDEDKIKIKEQIKNSLYMNSKLELNNQHLEKETEIDEKKKVKRNSKNEFDLKNSKQLDFLEKTKLSEKEDKEIIYEKFNQGYIDLYEDEEQIASGDLFTLLNNDEIIAEVNQVKSSYSHNDFILPENFENIWDNSYLNSKTNK